MVIFILELSPRKQPEASLAEDPDLTGIARLLISNNNGKTMLKNSGSPKAFTTCKTRTNKIKI